MKNLQNNVNDLETDLAIRDYWKDYMRERSLEVLAQRFGVSEVGIWKIEYKQMLKLTQKQNLEIKMLRVQYHKAKTNFMPKFRISEIAKRHNVSTHLVIRRRQKRIKAEAKAFYEQKAVELVKATSII